MIDDRYIPLVMDYLEGQLTLAQEQELKELLEAGVLKEQELKEYSSMLLQLKQLPEPPPSPRLRNNFYTMLAQAEAEEKRPTLVQRLQGRLERLFWYGKVQAGAVLAGALLLILGIGFGYWLRPVQVYEQQISQLQQQVVEMQQVVLLNQLEQSSATERLRAVNQSQELPQVDQQVIRALLNTLNSDPSINVRLAAIEALHAHAQHPLVREGLVRSFEQQDSPLVLMALAEEMAALQERRGIKPMQKLLEQDELDSTVKQQINKSIQILL